MSVRIADLPTTTQVDKNSYVIIEKPGFEEGTFKSTVGKLQEAITVEATVSQLNNVTTIDIHDINNDSHAEIVTPTATVHDNGNNSITITITDTNGTTTQTLVQNAGSLDPQPTPDSGNLVTSGAVYTALQALVTRITALENSVGFHIQLVE